MVSKTYPKYTVCYFFSGLIYSALEYQFGIESSSFTKLNTDQDFMDQGLMDQGPVDLVVIDDSQLLNRFGHYKKQLVTKVIHEESLKMCWTLFRVLSIENEVLITD